jgi:hypothetical protein
MIARLKEWFARRRRIRAAERMNRLWTCWWLFFRHLHKDAPSEPQAMSERRFSELVYWHKLMVSRWW